MVHDCTQTLKTSFLGGDLLPHKGYKLDKDQACVNKPTPQNLCSIPKNKKENLSSDCWAAFCPFFDRNKAETSSNLLKTSPIMQTRPWGSAREPPPRRLGWATRGTRWPRAAHHTAVLCKEIPAPSRRTLMLVRDLKSFKNRKQGKSKPRPYSGGDLECSIGPCPPLSPSVASAAQAAWSTTAPSSLPRCQQGSSGVCHGDKGLLSFQ